MADAMTADLVSETSLKQAAEILRDKYDVARIILFGSKAGGKATKDSDIDLCVLIKRPAARMLDVKRAMRHDIRSVIHAPMDILAYEEDTFYDRAAAVVSIEASIDRTGIDL